MSGGPIVAQAEPGLVAIEWPKEDIAPEFLALEQHAALMTAAVRWARNLGLRPSNGGAVAYTVQRPDGEALRFVWGEEKEP